MKTKDDETEQVRMRPEAVAPGSWIGVVSQVSQRLVEAALGGVSDHELVALFGNALAAAGLEISAIEVACDAVDPERAETTFDGDESATSSKAASALTISSRPC
jgi:hypothetical protein